MLYALGSNGSGQLGVSDRIDSLTPRECLFNSQNEIISNPKQIVAGGNHTLVLLESGDLYSAGSNIDGRAGLFSTQQTSETFGRVSIPPYNPLVKLCSALWEASVIVTTNDEVYTFGTGSKGELGNGSQKSAQAKKILDFPPPHTSIIDIASSVSHSVAVLSNGEAFGWGNGRKGQLGEPAEIVYAPRKIKDLQFQVVRAVCGREFTYLAAAPREGHHAILGADRWGVRSTAPPSIIDWKNIGASWGSIFVLKSSGNIDSWGRSDRGQLAPKNLPKIKDIAVGSEHVVALTHSGKVLAWGWGEHGNCGPGTDENGDVKNRWNEIELNTLDKNLILHGVAAGCATTFCWV